MKAQCNHCKDIIQSTQEQPQKNCSCGILMIDHIYSKMTDDSRYRVGYKTSLEDDVTFIYEETDEFKE